MAKCKICNKGSQSGHAISITRSQVSRRANKTWHPNVHKIKILVNGTVKRVNVCTSCMRADKIKRAC